MMENNNLSGKPPVVSITFYDFRGFKNRFWAFSRMPLAGKYLKDIDNLKFHRLLGTGRGNGFHWKADFSTYALLTVWENEEQAEHFLSSSEFQHHYKKHSKEQFTVLMHPVKSHGRWTGINPFQPLAEANDNGFTAVITRATLAITKLPYFWSYVPRVSAALSKADGLLMAKGIGEWPIFQMATFSLWQNETAMINYAYKNPVHRKVIHKAREFNWFNEDLFARFKPFKSFGLWDGKRPLPF